MSDRRAREEARRLFRQEVSSFVEPQWKTRAHFPGCHKCGSPNHRGRFCDIRNLKCDYCDVTSHNTVVCYVLHAFCFRCSVFGHKPNPDLKVRCLRHSRQADWDRCKTAGLFTRSPEFHHDANWAKIAADIKTKFGRYIDDAKACFSTIMEYALTKDADPDCELPWAWHQQHHAAHQEPSSAGDRSRKRPGQQEPELIDLGNEDERSSSSSKYHRNNSGHARARGHPHGGFRGGRGGHGRDERRDQRGRGHQRGRGEGQRHRDRRGRGQPHHGEHSEQGATASERVQRDALATIRDVMRYGKL
jgi:hypothetical protein